MAYIKKEDAIKAMRKAQQDRTWSMSDVDVMEQMEENVEALPTADVVEVVRCRNCKHAYFRYNTKDTLQEIYACEKRPAGRAHKKVSGDFFCKHGQRKEGD